ncbi:hypothetical protein H4Q26_008673 [Puccinia striiformis f. sp. tritici PST-130]|nr:hypothetical protein H4Q26_008673 [Puccinia striiformis f. sp. tritici PST-130]
MGQRPQPRKLLPKLYLNPAKGDSVYAPVLDGCAFGTKDKRISVDEGCASIWVTRALFIQLGGKPGEHNVTINSWDFEQYDARETENTTTRSRLFLTPLCKNFDITVWSSGRENNII